jgi:hypothetical protein
MKDLNGVGCSTNCAFGEYFGNRVGEILDNQALIEKCCQVGNNGEWWHTASRHNAADQATRCDSSPLDILQESRWPQGPEYLWKPISEWPISREFSARKDDCIPSNELLKQFRCLIQMTESSFPSEIEKIIDPMRTNDWNKIVRLTQTLLQWLYTVHVPNASAATILQHAKRLWFLSAMPDTVAALKAGRLKELDIKDDNALPLITLIPLSSLMSNSFSLPAFNAATVSGMAERNHNLLAC